jgi:hypothetical protein
MNFLLLSQLPHVEESRPHYDAMLSLHADRPRRMIVLWRRLRALFR